MASKGDDDFWNESSSSGVNLSGFNFFDEDDEVSLSVADVNTFMQDSGILPIHSIISNKSLNIILDDVNNIGDNVDFPEETIKKIFHNQYCVLGKYRTLDEKVRLLDSALQVCDGNIIISVTIFLKKTLKRNIFFNCLSKRKVAVKHYSNYLLEKNNYEELADLYMATGNIFNLKDIYYLLSKDISNQQILLKKLEQFINDHAQNLSILDNKSEIQDNIAFIRWKIENKLSNDSMVGQLIDLCKVEFEKRSSDDLVEYKKKFKLDDFQYEWVVMNVLCKIENWDKLLSTFIKTVWVLKKRALKSVIRPELFVLTLGKYKPPSNILEQFYPCVGDVDKCLYLAEKLGSHLYLINYYLDQKDRTSLLKCMNNVEPGGEEFQIIHNALNNSDIKWKN